MRLWLCRWNVDPKVHDLAGWVRHRSPRLACFHASQEDWLIDRPPNRERIGFMLPSGELCFRVPSTRPLPHPFGGSNYLPGFRPSLDITKARLLVVRLPGPHYVASSGDLNLSMFYSALALRGLVSSRSRAQDPCPVQGFVLSAQGPCLVGRNLPPCR
jgi:hypothetical protein